MMRQLAVVIATLGLSVPALAQGVKGSMPATKSPVTASAAGSSVARVTPARTATPAKVEYQIGPEDVLDISVWKNPELSRSVPVRPDGKVSLPLLNDVHAAGLTPAALREELTTRLSEYLSAPEVSVIVREVHSAKVSVVGAVRTPGRYQINSPVTVLELIALAQGFTDFAAKDRIVVLRTVNGVQRRIPFNYTRIADGYEQDNFPLQAGDILVVP